MKLSRVVTLAVVLWFAYQAFRTIRKVETMKPRDPFAPVN